MPRPLRLLFVATKAPWPPRDGGRLLQLETLRLLAAPAAGEAERVEVELVAPVPRRAQPEVAAALEPFCRPRLVDARPLPLPLALLLATARRLPVTAVRHRLPAVARLVEAAAADGGFDLVHAEQVQAMPQALVARLPVVLRAQNVESDLWRGAAARGVRGGVLAALRRGEGERLARWEGAMVGRAALTLALSERDAEVLAALAPGARVEAVPVPFPAELPAGPELPGEPAVSLLVGEGWRPNRDGAEAFVSSGWPRVRERWPRALLHVFGRAHAAGPGVVHHAAPADAAIAFAAGSVLVVPLALASGVRMKLLEAWARGVPVAATPAAVAGSAAAHGRELLVGELAEGLADAVAALAGDAVLRTRLVAAGRELLRRRHHPALARRAILAAYGAAAAPAARG
jgi:hypothetical protein